MKILYIIFISIFFTSLNANNENNTQDIKINKFIFFDAVEKKIILNDNLPNNFENLINNWFEKNIKVNGFTGEVEIIINKFSDKLTNIDDGKNYEVEVDLTIHIIKNGLLNKKSIEISLKEFSKITGYFKLSEVDEMIELTQINLIKRLNEKLVSNI